MLHAHLVVTPDVQPYGVGVLPHHARVSGQQFFGGLNIGGPHHLGQAGFGAAGHHDL